MVEWKKKVQSVSTRERENRALSVCSHTHRDRTDLRAFSCCKKSPADYFYAFIVQFFIYLFLRDRKMLRALILHKFPSEV